MSILQTKLNMRAPGNIFTRNSVPTWLFAALFFYTLPNPHANALHLANATLNNQEGALRSGDSATNFSDPDSSVGNRHSLPDVASDSPINAVLEKVFKKDYTSARSLLVPLLSVDDANALHIKAVLDENGWGGEKDLANAIRLYARAAEKGQVDAQFSLGELAYGRRGVRRDVKRALEWYQLAANQGHPGAKSRIGTIYARGDGVEKDLQLGLRYFEEAAASGDREAQFNIGVAYLNGNGRPQDYKKAGEWFTAAAQQAHPDAQFNLALLYDSPHLGEPDPQQTLFWMTAAARHRLPKAYVALGLMIGEGRGAGQSDRVAADWFERAALAGDPEGQFLYALVLSRGMGRPKRINEALRWLDTSLLDKSLDDQQISQRRNLRKQLIKDGAKPSKDIIPANLEASTNNKSNPAENSADYLPINANEPTASAAAPSEIMSPTDTQDKELVLQADAQLSQINKVDETPAPLSATNKTIKPNIPSVKPATQKETPQEVENLRP